MPNGNCLALRSKENNFAKLNKINIAQESVFE